MPDQATQLRRLIRDVKTNPSPRVALPPIIGIASAQEGLETAQITFELAAALAAMHRRVLLVGSDASYCRPHVNEFLSIAAVNDVAKLLQLHEAGHLPVSENFELVLVDVGDASNVNWLRQAHQLVLATLPTTEAMVESYSCVKKLAESGAVNHEKVRLVLTEYVPRAIAGKLLQQFAATCEQFINLRVAEGCVLAGVDRQHTVQASAALAHELAIACLATAMSFSGVAGGQLEAAPSALVNGVNAGGSRGSSPATQKERSTSENAELDDVLNNPKKFTNRFNPIPLE